MAVTPANPKTESSAVTEIKRFGFPFVEVADYDLSKLSPERRVQGRELLHYAPKEEVARYAVQMGEVSFPPIIVTSDDWLVDGNTRVGAALLRKQKFFPAIILGVSYEDAVRKTKLEVEALAATLNCQNGRPLTPKEQRDRVGIFLELGWTNEKIGRNLGVNPATIMSRNKEIRAAARTRQVGLSFNGSIKGPSLRALGGDAALNLNDAPYKELAELANDAGLNAKEITDHAKEIKALGSDELALARIAEIRNEMGERVRERSLTGISKPPVARQLRQHLGFVGKFAGNEVALVETNATVAEKHMDSITTAIAVLQQAQRLQEGQAMVLELQAGQVSRDEG